MSIEIRVCLTDSMSGEESIEDIFVPVATFQQLTGEHIARALNESGVEDEGTFTSIHLHHDAADSSTAAWIGSWDGPSAGAYGHSLICGLVHRDFAKGN